MQKKYLSAYYLLFILLSSITIPSSATELNKSLLWSLQHPSTQTTHYLFGTMHSEKPDVVALLPKIQVYINKTSRLFLELSLDKHTMSALFQQMLFPNKKRLVDIIPPQRYQKIKQQLVQYYNIKSIERLRLWMLISLLNMPKEEQGNDFLDRLIYQYAVNKKIEAVGLETVEEQVAIIDGLSLAQQIILLEESLKNRKAIMASYQQMYAAYLAEDLQQLWVLNMAQMQDTAYPDLSNILMQRLLHTRNQRMVQRLKIYLKQEQASFIAVGALHLVGESGLLQGLQQQGYHVRPIALQ